ncbi:MAG: toll/interleukin-1 receptor domain-containing protein [Pseudomonadota bacterium]
MDSNKKENSYFIFISYMHCDNIIPAYNDNSWIENTILLIQQRLKEILPRREIIFYSDKEYTLENRQLNGELKNNLNQADAMICFLSAAYFTSPFRMEELAFFINSQKDNNKQIFKIHLDDSSYSLNNLSKYTTEPTILKLSSKDFGYNFRAKNTENKTLNPVGIKGNSIKDIRKHHLVTYRLSEDIKQFLQGKLLGYNSKNPYYEGNENQEKIGLTKPIDNCKEDSENTLNDTNATIPYSNCQKQEGLEHKKNKVFICYSKKDTLFCDALIEHLNVLTWATTGGSDIVPEIWSDTKIQPGEDWDKEIKKALKTTKVAIFLMSRNFFSTEYIKNIEFHSLMDQYKDKDLKIIPIKAYQCHVPKGISFLQSPNYNAPLSKMNHLELDDFFTELVGEIEKLLG